MNDIDYMHLPRLRLEHLNGRGSGSALQMFLVPATACEAGHIRIEITDQKGKTRFDWDRAACASLGAFNLAKLLMVFNGELESTDQFHAEDDRIIVDTDGRKALVTLHHKVDPSPVYLLCIVASGRGDDPSARKRALELSPSEALAVAEAIRGGLHTVAFGVPVLREVR